MRHFVLAAVIVVAPVAGAQVVPGSIDPGMSRAQVIERLGPPASERSASGYRYLLYENGCARACGMSDLVTLQGDSVIDAIFRAAERSYTGQSSSPTQGMYGRAARAALSVSQSPTRRPPSDRRAGANAGTGGFALPAEWTTGASASTGNPPPTSIDSIILDITALPPEPKPAGRAAASGSILPAEWLGDAPVKPSRDSAAKPAAPRPVAPSSVLPAEWLTDAPPAAAGAGPAAPAVPPTPRPAPPAGKSLLPAEWVGETSPAGAGAPPSAPAPRPDSAKKAPLIPTEWLSPTPPGAPPKADSTSRRPAANPFVVTPPVAPPPPVSSPRSGA